MSSLVEIITQKAEMHKLRLVKAVYRSLFFSVVQVGS